jgi:multidrug resistance efflux pump
MMKRDPLDVLALPAAQCAFADPAPPPSADAASLLATLLTLIKRAREAVSSAELGFVLVNETHALLRYRQAALWWPQTGVSALSGVVSPEANAPYVQWLDAWCRAHRPPAGPATVHELGAGGAAAGEPDGSEWLPAHLVAVPLKLAADAPDSEAGILLLANDEPFAPAELALLDEWAQAWSASFAARQPRSGWITWRSRWQRGPVRRRWLLPSALAAALALVCWPVTLTVLAPAELVPLNPAVIRAPLDGVVEKMLVQPNERVVAGQPLFEFDRVSLENRLQLAQRSLDTVRAEYRQRAQRALFEADSKSQLAVLQSQMDEKAVEVAYLRALNGRGVATAPRDGVVLLDDAQQWVGRPVVTGERIMVVADERQVALEAWLSPADLVDFPSGAAVTLYLAADPLRPVTARLGHVAPMAQLRPDGHYAHRLRAELLPDGAAASPRVGMKGTARIAGERVPVVYWVLRRPWAALRGWLGL